MPGGVVDRDADVWESLLAIADAVGGALATSGPCFVCFPCFGCKRRDAQPWRAVARRPARGVWRRREDGGVNILQRLNGMEEAPWGDMRGKPLDDRGLSNG